MKIRAQIGMVLNLDKCIGCHTCSVTCKNVWSSREGMEYAWFNNVETKPGIGYPKNVFCQRLRKTVQKYRLDTRGWQDSILQCRISLSNIGRQRMHPRGRQAAA